MKLYYRPGACSLAAHIVLAWLDLPYEVEVANTRDPEFSKVNYLGTVPVLFTPDMGALYQNSAILRYLSRLPAGEPFGPGADPVLKAQCDYWLSFFNADVYRAFAPFFNPEKYTTDTSAEAKKAIKAAVPAQVQPLFKRMDSHLASRDYYLEDEMGIIDACAFVYCYWASKVLANGLADYPNVARHYATLLADPKVKAVIAKEGLKL
ncbi:glutathione S-transferase family protein [Oceanisphaera avium]|uniref:Glutathione S-transferase n=1 Tax=Oceanisphaera avium TaxID=1903694 RepID=A0A1Y0CZH9_9GAMM|nr:glutathione S-transferase family protein [Oceanisphaera avium]ART80719.1 glutathione S-transferase [Oceanisphaera avium]